MAPGPSEPTAVAESLLARLRELGVEVRAQGDQLRLVGPRGAVSAGLLQELAAQKATLLRLVASARPAVNEIERRPPMARRPSTAPALLSYAQERLHFVHKLDPESVAFAMPTAMRLRGTLSFVALEQSLRALVTRHEALRTSFQSINGVLQQVVGTGADFHLERLPAPAGDSEHPLSESIRRFARRPFDLEKGAPLRAGLLPVAGEDHVLILVLHHICSDGWSSSILSRELVELYSANREGRPSSLPPLALQYPDFAHWQRGWLRGEVLERKLAYWTQQLAGIPPLLELPTDFPRPAVHGDQGARRHYTVPAACAQRWRALAKSENATLFMTLLSGLSAVLSRHSGQSDVVIGTSVANRDLPELEGIVGLLINQIALRCPVNLTGTFSAHLQQVKRTTLDAAAHQDVPFDRVVDAVKPPRSLAHTPVFQVGLTFLNVPRQTLKLPGCELEYLPADARTAQIDLQIWVNEEADGSLSGMAEYRTNLFLESRIEMILDHWWRLLDDAASGPTTAVGRLSLLSEGERRTLTEIGRGPVAQKPGPAQTFQQYFEAQVLRSPDRVAAVDDRESVTYAELNRQANRIAWALKARGVAPDDRVALIATRSVGFLAAVLGVFKTGASYVPLDPVYPLERLGHIHTQSAPRVVVAEAALVPLAAQLSLNATHPPVTLEELRRIGTREDNPPECGHPQNVAYVIFTSGSTGTPKGAMVEQRGMVNHLLAKVADLALNENDTIIQSASQCFDISVFQFLVCLLVGGRVRIADGAVAGDPRRLLALVRDERATVLEVVPSVLRVLADGTEAPPLALRWLVATGETLPPELARRWHAFCPTVPLVNVCGPTECSDNVVHHILRTPPAEADARVPIGKPIPHTQLYVLDERLQLVPWGAAGELFVGGVGVGRGYLGRPELTASSFLPNPFGPPGARLYRTGDLTRWNARGELEHLGRVDHQVKVRGFRIELQEIEVALEKLPEVAAAIVTAREDARQSKRLVAYVMRAAGAAPEVSLLQSALRAQLPEYMVPPVFVLLDRFPLMPNGKVNRFLLPDPAEEKASPRRPPRTDTERVLATIWQELFAGAEVGLDDNFFELGGDSILILELVHRARAAGLVVRPKHVFERQTLEGLAETVVPV